MKRRTIWIACGAAALICLLICVSMRSLQRGRTADEEQFFTAPTGQPSDGTSAEQEAEEPAEEAEPYVSPVDFEALWAVNEDAYAWLYIPGTEISYPILQHPEDDGYYLRRGVDGHSDPNGVIYTEASYNGRDFTDPLTVAYGHNMKSGQMFGTLQREYSSAEALAEHERIIVYLPDRELHYDVFAAVPFDNRHILYNYDFTDQRTFRLFFNEILSVRALEAVYADDTTVMENDRVLILSTCLAGNRKNRFLVCGKLSETIPINTTEQNGGQN